ncbi:cytochrome c oxidase subunit 8A, mitochondrial [Paramormyrops kingsleyae]|uniref:Cytochrome c oxidase subunit 8B, mitochondrial n=1 Tax=Paramormyrops kingsleyae TaxID=1676925 RepID=A0A3B3QCM9_9TELE|nr:cytochrome c oxidase subunit 8B, mitochondrial [Paramormyrops kingsleyae]
MPGLLRGVLSARPLVRRWGITQRAGITTKPAKDPVGASETVIGLTAFMVSILAPAGWVLANLESYKKRD